MRKLFLLTIALIIAMSLNAKDTNAYKLKEISDEAKKITSKSNNRDGNYSEIFVEDFENGASDWTAVDETDPGTQWHIDTYNAYGDSGKSWWMGNPDVGANGGYLDNWYQVLDTPEITLPAAGEMILSFEQYRAMESPGIHENFDGWDGFNVRIRKSDEDYNQAVILTAISPEYNCSSMYSFGFIHEEDPDGIPGIPGWGGSTAWSYTSMSIPDSYHSKKVIISFAFASDGAECTEDCPALTGIFIDNINVADVFFNNGEDTTGFHAYSNTPIGGQLWHRYKDTDAPSPTHALGCFDPATGTYNPNMDNYFISPEIELPSGLDIIWDMQIKDELDEPSSELDCDYIIVQLRYLEGNQWSGWNSVSNPLGGQPQFVFTGNVNEWAPFSLCWPGYNDISVLAGYTVQFRIGLHSNADDSTAFGLCIDNFEIFSVLDLNPPRNLNAEYNYESNKVELCWNPPLLGNSEELSYNNSNWVSYISDAQPYAIKVSNQYDYDLPLVSVNFMLYSEDSKEKDISGTVDVIVWEDEGGKPGEVLYTVEGIGDIQNQIYKNVDVSSANIKIPAFDNIFVGITNFNTSNQGILAENTDDKNHSLCFSMGSWNSINEVYETLTNISITANVLINDPTAEQPIGYNIYRSLSDNMFDNVLTNVTDTVFTDDSFVPGNIYYYAVTAVYEEGESNYSNEVWAFVEIPTAQEYAYDDGNVSEGYSAGVPLNSLAVRITPDNYPVRVIRLKYFLFTNSKKLVLQIWEEEENGKPGEELLNPPLIVETDNLIANDWNIITLPEEYNIIIEQGDFFIGWVEVKDNSLIGLDNGIPSNDRSYKYTNGEWLDYSDEIPQNLMMRTIVDTLPALKANFTANKISGTVPLKIQFQDLSANVTAPITNWLWYFGDEDSSLVQNPVHTYQTSGIYTVSLSIIDENDSSATVSKNDYISVYPQIWSGDTDNNGIVDTLDILPIGVYFRESCTSRDVVSFDWIGHEFPGSWSEQNVAFADCNGDGTVNITDVLAIGLNWNKSHQTFSSSFTLPSDLTQYRESFVEIYDNCGEGEISMKIKNFIARTFNLAEVDSIKKNILFNSFPNPFSNSATINFYLKNDGQSGYLTIYNVRGQMIRQFSLQSNKSGENTIIWNGKDQYGAQVGNGLYLYMLEIDGKTVATKKMVFMK